ncbi:MAG: guanylate kinase [Alphaproteobacteria bacterium]|nr:MAG: guanylate kinase [Alphaproteobacteria bacterium]
MSNERKRSQSDGRTGATGTHRPGLLLIISSPSGAGKSTLANRLLREEGDRLWMSVSVTTRPRRKSEIAGQDYHFVTAEEFARMARAGAFLEHAEVFGHHYGTPRAPVEEKLKAGIDVLFDIDWQGAAQIRRNLARSAYHVVSVFILPPTMAELEARLRRRAQDPEEVIARRMAGARDEITHWQEYDYVLVNDDLDRCFHDLKTVLDAERLRLDKNYRYRALAESLLAERVPARS